MAHLRTSHADENPVPHLREAKKFHVMVSQESVENMEMSPAVAQFLKEFKFDGKQVKRETGLSETTNTTTTTYKAYTASGGYISKIRYDQKPKEKKIPLVNTHQRVAFKQTSVKKTKSVKQTKRINKTFTVPTPEIGVPKDDVDENMDIDTPMVRIRQYMTRVPKGVKDIDDTNDPFKCPVYAQDICDYLQAVERRWTFPANFLKKHGENDVTPKMRCVLMDWLIQVQVHQELSQYTLHMCAAIVDRYLCLKVVPVSILQLLGITALLIASKFHERYSPEIEELCHLTDNSYNKGQVLVMERSIFQALDFNLSFPDPIVFLDRFIEVKPNKMSHMIRCMSLYLLDVTLHEVEFVYFPPSLLAASTIYVSQEILGYPTEWDKAYSHYTKYSKTDLTGCVQALRKVQSKITKYQGAHKKYTHSNFHGISSHPNLHLALTPHPLWHDPADMSKQSVVTPGSEGK